MKVVLLVSAVAVAFTSGMLFGISILPTPKPTIVPVYLQPASPSPAPDLGSPA